MATPRHAHGHATTLTDTDPRAVIIRPAPHNRRRRTGLVLGTAATACLAFTAVPGTAAADPGPAQLTQQVADLNHQLEILSEQVNQARTALDQEKVAAGQADQAAVDAQARLQAMDGQIRKLARSAYTSSGVSQLDVLLTSNSADDLVSQLGTLDAIAGHQAGQVHDVVATARSAERARAQADEAEATAQRTVDTITAKQAELQNQVTEYQRKYAALTAPQQQAVVTAVSGKSVPAPAVATVQPVTAAAVQGVSSAAQAAVATALAQVGKPYVYGASGPGSFDCSGLTMYAWAAAGKTLPHSASGQSTMGTPVAKSDLQPGDLIFYYSPVSHVAMYIGDGKMVHASTSGQPVKVVDLGSMPGYNSARRVG